MLTAEERASAKRTHTYSHTVLTVHPITQLEEEANYREEMLKAEERASAKRSNQKAKIQYDLMDAIPLSRQSTQFAREMDLPASFSVKVGSITHVASDNQPYVIEHSLAYSLTHHTHFLSLLSFFSSFFY
jgi:hypothetical protein